MVSNFQINSSAQLQNSQEVKELFKICAEGDGQFKRLLERHKRIIDANLDAITNKKVLDLAASNGRWSFAAVNSGASSVIAVEGRSEKVQEAHRFIEKQEIKNCQFIEGDIFDWLYENKHQRFDTVLCLGIYYHITDHYRLLRLIANTKPKTIIIDSGFVRTFQLMTHIITEDPDLYTNVLPNQYMQERSEIVGVVSLGLMLAMAWNCGYSCIPILWDPKTVEEPSVVQDYMMGRRFTLRLDWQGENNQADWVKQWKEPLSSLNPKLEYLFDNEKLAIAIDARARHLKCGILEANNKA